MQRTLRSTIATTAVAAVTSAALVGATQAPAAATTPQAQSGATWLAGQLTTGKIVGQYGVDWGLTIDSAFALKAAGNQATKLSQVKSAVAGGLAEYINGSAAYGDPNGRYGGATAKALTAAQVVGGDPRSFGGYDLVARVRSLLVASGASQGRLRDVSAFGDYSNTIGQAFAVEGLAAAGAPSSAATSFLLKQQCSAGYFRLADSDGKTCEAGAGTPDVDVTAAAVSALLSAKSDHVAGLDAAIAKGAAWLVSAQGADGSFGGAGPTSGANSNSTGLAAQALAAAGKTTDAVQAVTWLKKLQVTSTTGGPLATQVGAVAYDSAGFALAKTDGVTAAASDQWQRATAQAVLGLSGTSMGSLLPTQPVRRVTVVATHAYVQGGRSVAIAASGLAAGETFSVSLSGRVVKTATATSTGRGSVSVTAPSSTSRPTVGVRGLTSGRTGSTSISVLGAKTLHPKLKHATVVRKHQQKVTIKHLAAGEHVTLKYRKHKISAAGARANSNGVYRLWFKVGAKTGVKTVHVHGEFTTRHGSKTFRVVR